MSQTKDDLPRYYTVVLFSFLDKSYSFLLIKVSALPYVKETDLKLLSDFLKERVMGKGLAQQFDDSKSLQGFI